jgi:2',3'-cyclic-nucleotide 2'-phosphodiesterase (5'-nucleotidase family)
MDYVALNLGEAEFLVGEGVLEKMKEWAEFPLVSSNLSSSDPLWDPHVIKEVNGVKIAIMGVISPALVPGGAFVSVEPPIDALRRVMADLSDKADVFILLSHMGPEETLALVREIDGIDVAIISHVTCSYEMETVGKTLVVSAGEKGGNLGHVKGVWGAEEKKVVSMSYENHPLGNDIARDDGIRQLISDFTTSVNETQAKEYKEKKRRKEDEREAEIKAMVERTMKMTPEEFFKYYHEEMEERTNTPQ